MPLEAKEHVMENQTQYPPLDLETRAAVDTATAAFHLNRKPKTLRAWASAGSGPLAPLRIHGRLAWSVEQIRSLQQRGTSRQRATSSQ
jgi:hypothetical protein